MSLSLVAIVPAAHVAAINALGPLMGRGASEYSVALSATGVAPATHYGLRAWAGEATRTQFTALQASPALAPAVPGHMPAAITAAIAAVVLDWRADTPGAGAQHWVDVLAARGLKDIAESGA